MQKITRMETHIVQIIEEPEDADHLQIPILFQPLLIRS